MGIPRRTILYWVKREKDSKLGDSKSKSRRPWSKVKAEEEKLATDQARLSPELSYEPLEQEMRVKLVITCQVAGCAISIN